MNSWRVYVYFPWLINMHAPPLIPRCRELAVFSSFFLFSFIQPMHVPVKRWLKACLLLLFQLREYTLTESYHEDDVEVEFVSNDNLQANSETPRGIDPNRDLNEAIAEERREMDTQRYRYASPYTISPSISFLGFPRQTFYFVFLRLNGSRKSRFAAYLINGLPKSKNCQFSPILHIYVFESVRIQWNGLKNSKEEIGRKF